MISIQEKDFDLGKEYSKLAQGTEAGAVVTFVGRVRDFPQTDQSNHTGSNTLFLEHYAGMTERVLEDIIKAARDKWSIHEAHIIHRIGELLPSDQIVYVGVSSRHRKDAFAACEYIMDFLKTQAPFWKKEGSDWVEAKTSDDEACKRWQ